ncbi:MAG: hypothetical protein OQK75_11860 [Gammaproteobacteria bacterium]|nr:hypothetical protein [Gammaproteobacteria bacterium]
MSIKLNIELKPFIVPEYVLIKQKPKSRQEGFNANPEKFHLKDLDAETLGQLCDEFRASVFTKAGVKD